MAPGPRHGKQPVRQQMECRGFRHDAHTGVHEVRRADRGHQGGGRGHLRQRGRRMEPRMAAGHAHDQPEHEPACLLRYKPVLHVPPGHHRRRQQRTPIPVQCLAEGRAFPGGLGDRRDHRHAERRVGRDPDDAGRARRADVRPEGRDRPEGARRAGRYGRPDHGLGGNRRGGGLRSFRSCLAVAS